MNRFRQIKIGVAPHLEANEIILNEFNPDFVKACSAEMKEIPEFKSLSKISWESLWYRNIDRHEDIFRRTNLLEEAANEMKDGLGRIFSDPLSPWYPL